MFATIDHVHDREYCGAGIGIDSVRYSAVRSCTAHASITAFTAFLNDLNVNDEVTQCRRVKCCVWCLAVQSPWR